MTRSPETEPRLDEPALADLLSEAQRRVARRASSVLADEGCTIEEWRVLRSLGDREGHLMGELAESLLIPHATLSRVVEGLADKSVVYRRHSPDDRRKVAVFLSRTGAERLSLLNALVAREEHALQATPEWTELAERLRVALG